MRELDRSPMALPLLTGTAHAVLSAALFLWLGAMYHGDSHEYLESAAALRHGHLVGRAHQFPAYVAILAANEKIGAGRTGAILGAIIAMSLATAALVYLAQREYGRLGAVLVAIFFGLNPEVMMYERSILTDGYFVAGVALSITAIWLTRERRTSAYYATSIALIVATSLTRPSGWFLVPCAVVVWGAGRWRAALLVPLAVVAVVIVPVLPGFGGAADAQSPGSYFTGGYVTWDKPTSPRLPMPAATRPVDSMSDIGLYAARHPLPSARLAATRVGYELVRWRAIYPVWRSAGAAASAYLLYVFAVIGVARDPRKPLHWMCVAQIAAYLAIITVTFADKHARYYVWFLAPLAVLAASGLVDTTARVTTWSSDRTRAR